VSAPLIALLSLTLAAAAASATISINAASPRRSCVGNTPDQSCCSRSRKLGLALSGVTLAAAVPSATLSINAAALAPRCSVSAPLIALSDVTLADAAASATLSINAASPPQLRRQHSRSMPLRRAAAASATLPIKLLLSPSEAWAAQAARCSVSAPLIALSGVTLAAEAASATLSINTRSTLLLSLSEA
jgi:hypothetical protein